MGDKLDNVLNSTMVLIVGAVILCSAAIPIVVDQVNGLLGDNGPKPLDGWISMDALAGIIAATIILAIIGLLIVVIRSYNNSDR